MSSIQLRVKELLKQKGWTTKVLAEKTGMSESYLTHMKNGTRRWNEDGLSKIALAFDLQPVELICNKNFKPISTTQVEPACPAVDYQTAVVLTIQKIPVLKEIPKDLQHIEDLISKMNNEQPDKFLPLCGKFGQHTFALAIENQNLAPKFVKNDHLVIDPAAKVSSGDIVAIEYKTDKTYTKIVSISFLDNLIMLESVNHKHSPIALSRENNTLRIIGKVVYLYQKLP